MIACFSIQKDTIFITHHSVSAPHFARCFVDTCIARRQDGGQIPRCQQHKRAFSGRKWCKSASDFTSSIIHYHIIILSRKFILRCSSQSTTFSIRHPIFSESSDPRDMMSHPPFPSPCVSSQRIPVPMWVSTSPLAGMHIRCTNPLYSSQPLHLIARHYSDSVQSERARLYLIDSGGSQ